MASQDKQIKLLKMLGYTTLKKIYAEQYHVDGLDYSDLVELFNLIGVLYKAFKSKDPKLTVYELAYKVFKRKVLKEGTDEFEWEKIEEGTIDNFILPLSIQIEVLYDNGFLNTKTNLKDTKSIVSKINQIYDRWVPF